jgi:hypothetical protein
MSSPFERRKTDAAALQAIESMESNASVAEICSLFNAAGVPVPVAVGSHPRKELTRLVSVQGQVAGRVIEAAMLRGSSASTKALMSEPEFVKYMQLRFQLTESEQVSSARAAPPPRRRGPLPFVPLARSSST